MRDASRSSILRAPAPKAAPCAPGLSALRFLRRWFLSRFLLRRFISTQCSRRLLSFGQRPSRCERQLFCAVRPLPPCLHKEHLSLFQNLFSELLELQLGFGTRSSTSRWSSFRRFPSRSLGRLIRRQSDDRGLRLSRGLGGRHIGGSHGWFGCLRRIQGGKSGLIVFAVYGRLEILERAARRKILAT